MAESCRPPCISRGPRRQAGRPVSEDPLMSAPAYRVAFSRRPGWAMSGLLVLTLVVLASAPLWAGRQELRLLAEIYAYVALASLWNLLAGHAGLVSVGQHAYVGLGAYALFALTIFLGIHPLLAIPICGFVGALIALPVAALVFRLRGHYFAIGTWVIAEVF